MEILKAEQMKIKNIITADIITKSFDRLICFNIYAPFKLY